MNPRIAISCDIQGDVNPKLAVSLRYLELVATGGGVPVILPPSPHGEELLDHVDGVIFIGGDDYRLGNRNGMPAGFCAVHERREESDPILARAALRRDLPVLGICGGYQLLVLVAGGNIVGDIVEELKSDVPHRREPAGEIVARHPIEWRQRDPRLEVPAGRHDVNSHHHQGIVELPPEWREQARADDGIVEAAWGPGRFQLGVQWHPEREVHAPLSRAIIGALLAASRERRGSEAP